MADLAIDLDRATSLADLLARWRPDAEAIIGLVVEAERLADEPVFVTARLDQIGDDGAAMRIGLRDAVELARDFAIDITAPPGAIDGRAAVAIALDEQRIRREIAQDHGLATTSDGADQVRAELADLYRAADRGEISDNDPRLDILAGRLRRLEDRLHEGLIDRLTPSAAARINELTERLAEIEGPRGNNVMAQLIAALDEVGFEGDTRREAIRLIVDGTPIEIALAEISGDWSAIPGGDPARYTDEERAIVLEVLGFDVGLDTVADAAGIDELFDALPDRIVAALFTVGVEQTFRGQVSLGTPLQSVLPAGASVARTIEGSVELSNVQVGVGFSRTHTVTISAQVSGSAEGRFGKSTLNRVYKWLRRFDRVPARLQQLLNRNPFLRFAARGFPFSMAYERFYGTELTYEATITADQAAALDGGDGSALPDVFSPLEMTPGTSVLIRGGVIEGSTFAAKYKAIYLEETITDFSGHGFGITRLADGRVAVYSGPIEAVERQTFFGLPFASLTKTTEVAEHDFRYAELDLSTDAGQSAYADFISGGGVPITTADGVVPGENRLLTIDSQSGAAIDLGFYRREWEIGGYNADHSVIDYADGTSVLTSTHSYGDSQVQFEAPLLADGTPDIEASTTTVVLADVDDALLNIVAVGFGAPIGSTEFDGDHHVQLVFDHDDLVQLGEQSRAYVRLYSLDDDHYQAQLDLPTPFDPIEQLAAAPDLVELIDVLDRFADHSPGQLLYGLGKMGFEWAWQTDQGDPTELLPGSIETIASS